MLKTLDCLLVSTTNKAQLAIRKAAPEVATQVTTSLMDSLEVAITREQCGCELLILQDPNEESLLEASQTQDQTGLPRWAIVVFGKLPPGDFECVNPSVEWPPAAIAELMRAAIAQHELRRENERLWGDLLTWATRLVHDLRTPLGAIVVNGDVLKLTLNDVQPDLAGFAKPILNSADELGKLLTRLSKFTRSSLTPAVPRPVEMSEIIWAVTMRHQVQAAALSATIRPAATWPAVVGVSAWLEEIWSNLVGNALQHGGQGVDIELGWTQLQNAIQFWVTDNGPGVEELSRTNLFQPFHHLHLSNARRGLGLSIVKRLVELQSGSCGMDSANGLTRFYFTLPPGK